MKSSPEPNGRTRTTPSVFLARSWPVSKAIPSKRFYAGAFFEPLGMENTDCLDQQHPDLTTGYHRAPNQDALDREDLMGRDIEAKETVDSHNIRGEWLYVGPRAAGAVQSTVHDMAKYASALLNKSTGIVKPETFDSMIAPQWSPDPLLEDVGLCFMRKNRFGRFTYGHGGGISGGWNTRLTVIPEENLAVLTHLNMDFRDFLQVESAIVRALLNAASLDLSNKATATSTLEAAPGVYGPSPGHLTNYRITHGTGRVQISAKDGELELRSRHGPWREGARMFQYHDDDPTYFILDTGEIEPPGVVFRQDGDGRVSEVLFDRMVHMYRDDRLEPWV